MFLDVDRAVSNLKLKPVSEECYSYGAESGHSQSSAAWHASQHIAFWRNSSYNLELGGLVERHSEIWTHSDTTS
jgi:hypothetical protein